jgi:hypothetical protein
MVRGVNFNVEGYSLTINQGVPQMKTNKVTVTEVKLMQGDLPEGMAWEWDEHDGECPTDEDIVTYLTSQGYQESGIFLEGDTDGFSLGMSEVEKAVNNGKTHLIVVYVPDEDEDIEQGHIHTFAR